MKKLTSLQILMLMSFAVGSSHIYSMSEAVALELQAVADEAATAEVLADLAEIAPMVVERIIEDEADLQATFSSIMAFVHKKNKEIDELNKAKTVEEVEVARLAVELADAQALLEKTIAKQRAKHKKANGHEQSIKDGLMKAEQNIKRLSKKAASSLSQFGSAVGKGAQDLNRQFKKSKAGKAVIKASSSAAQSVADASVSAAQYVADSTTAVAQQAYDAVMPSSKENNQAQQAQMMAQRARAMREARNRVRLAQGQRVANPMAASIPGEELAAPVTDDNLVSTDEVAVIDNAANEEVVVQAAKSGSKKSGSKKPKKKK